MFPPNIDPQLYAISASVVGAIIAPDMSALESYSVGNWLILVGHYLQTYAGQLLLIQNRNLSQCNPMMDINAILNALHKMECELEKMKKKES